MKRLSDAELDRLEAWHSASSSERWRCIVLLRVMATSDNNVIGEFATAEDARFALAAHVAIPSLLAELRELRQEVEAMRHYEIIAERHRESLDRLEDGE